MIQKWEEYWKQMEITDTELSDFLENGGLSSIAMNKMKKFIAAWNRQKKMAGEIDQYISPVEPAEVERLFDSAAFEQMWSRWKDYLLEQHGQLIKSRSEMSALEHLKKITKGNDDVAIECLRYAMANRYRNFFLVEDKDNKMPAVGDNSGSAFG
jgi:hypothetical protein